jgi:hypothetical protein
LAELHKLRTSEIRNLNNNLKTEPLNDESDQTTNAHAHAHYDFRRQKTYNEWIESNFVFVDYEDTLTAASK